MDEAHRMTGLVGVADLFPELETVGTATVSPYEFDERADFLFNLRVVRDAGPMFRMYNGKYCRLSLKGEGLVMSDTFMERKSNSEFVENARGKVLIAGLGLGLVVRNILSKPEVFEIVIVEKNNDVIDLVGPKFRDPKLRIVNADIFEWKTDEMFDTIYFDIWKDVDPGNLADVRVLHNRFKRKKLPGGWMNSWMKEFLQKRRRQENRESRLSWWQTSFPSLSGVEL